MNNLIAIIQEENSAIIHYDNFVLIKKLNEEALEDFIIASLFQKWEELLQEVKNLNYII